MRRLPYATRTQCAQLLGSASEALRCPVCCLHSSMHALDFSLVKFECSSQASARTQAKQCIASHSQHPARHLLTAGWPVQRLARRNIHIKRFDDIPMADAEMVFPDKRVYIKPLTLVCAAEPAGSLKDLVSETAPLRRSLFS